MRVSLKGDNSGSRVQKTAQQKGDTNEADWEALETWRHDVGVALSKDESIAEGLRWADRFFLRLAFGMTAVIVVGGAFLPHFLRNGGEEVSYPLASMAFAVFGMLLFLGGRRQVRTGRQYYVMTTIDALKARLLELEKKDSVSVFHKKSSRDLLYIIIGIFLLLSSMNFLTLSLIETLRYLGRFAN